MGVAYYAARMVARREVGELPFFVAGGFWLPSVVLAGRAVLLLGLFVVDQFLVVFFAAKRRF